MDLAEEGPHLNASNSPPRRRRSTFFERRSSIVPSLPIEDVAPQKDGNTDQYLQDISKYYSKLYEEKEAWKCEARERRHRYRDIKEQFQASASRSVSTPIDYSVLTKEDIDFLKGKLNVLKISESALDLNNQVTLTMPLMKRLKELNERVLDHCEERFFSVQKYILENSTIESFEEVEA